MDGLVSTQWLAERLDESDLVVLDASWFLPEHGRDPRAEFAERHIPGARFLDLAALVDAHDALPMMLPSDHQFNEAMRALGVSNDSRVVLYDDSPLHPSARGWWMLRLMGVPRVAILDGGLAAWRAEGRTLAQGDTPASPGIFVAHSDRGLVRDRAAMQANLANREEQVIDARSPTRFAGDEPEPRAGVEPGHIPGSINLPYSRLFDAEGRWRSREALRALFAEAGVDVDRPMVATCGSGVTAAAIVFALHLLGSEAALYDGSWADWGGSNLPKAKGTA
jgi:thiosulfate/3-mercaptopyruvate sulfurtransferase